MTGNAYGTAINDALADPDTTLDELKALHEHATNILESQGDLHGAVHRLKTEITRRESGNRPVKPERS